MRRNDGVGKGGKIKGRSISQTYRGGDTAPTMFLLGLGDRRASLAMTVWGKGKVLRFTFYVLRNA